MKLTWIYCPGVELGRYELKFPSSHASLTDSATRTEHSCDGFTNSWRRSRAFVQTRSNSWRCKLGEDPGETKALPPSMLRWIAAEQHARGQRTVAVVPSIYSSFCALCFWRLADMADQVWRMPSALGATRASASFSGAPGRRLQPRQAQAAF